VTNMHQQAQRGQSSQSDPPPISAPCGNQQLMHFKAVLRISVGSVFPRAAVSAYLAHSLSL